MKLDRSLSKKFILFILIIVSLTILVFLISSNKSGRVFLYETEYKLTNSNKALTKLCANTLFTDMYDKKIVYLPKIMDYKTYLKNAETIVKDEENYDYIYDCILNEYVFAFLLKGDYQSFKEKYSEISPKYRVLGDKYEYIMGSVISSKLSKEQMNILLETLNDTIPSVENNWIERVGTLNSESFIYEKLGDIEQAKKIDQEVEEIFKEKQKQKENKKL